MPATNYGEEKVLDLRFGLTTTAPATDFIGLLIANPWTPATVVTLGTTYVVGSAFATTNRHIFKCTTSGTTGGSEPTWIQTSGATTTDNTAVWTECTNLFEAGTFTNAEPSTGAYARASVTNNSTNWPVATGNNPATKSNGVTITFTTSTAAWGNVAGFLTSDASSAGNIWFWGLLTSLVDVGSGSITFQFTTTNLAFTLT